MRRVREIRAQPLLHPNLVELYRQKVAELHTALEHPTHAAEAVEKIRALIDAFLLMPEEGKLRVDLTGALAGILSVAQKDQRPRPEDEAHASQVKLVAGAGYHLCRTAVPWLSAAASIWLPEPGPG